MTVNWTNITDFGDFLRIPNTNSGGTFWNAILFMIIFVIFLSLITFSAEVAIMVALFIGLILATALYYAGLISVIPVGIIVGLLFFVIIYFMYKSRQNN